MIWSKKNQGRFPDSKELKQLVRDRVVPDKDLGHSDR
jgi:selenoprotein W-related protein